MKPTSDRPRLAILTTCSSRKAGKPKGTIFLRDIEGSLAAEERARLWIETLERAPFLPVEVEKLYRGSHWRHSSQAFQMARKRFAVSLWVLSAGYGLIPADRGQTVKPYQATFSRDEGFDSGITNTVSPAKLPSEERSAYEAAWWQVLTQWRNPFPGQPRTVTELVRHESLDALLVIASEPYLKVIEHDLLKAAEELYRPDRLVILSAGLSGPTRRRLARHALTFDARLAQRLEGALTSLNARVASWLLESLTYEDFNHAAIQARLNEALQGLEPLKLPARDAMTPDDVRHYLRAQSDLATASATMLLRRFRNEDLKSFEEKHFRRLVAEAKAQSAPLIEVRKSPCIN